MSHNMKQLPSQKGRRYMPGLDGLRALSVLAVIAYHLNIKWAQGGLLGVGIFFVISGYLITDQIIIEWRKQHRFNLLRFWKRRVRRLIPAMLWMLLCVGIWLVLFDPERLQSLQGAFLSSIFYVNNWWLIFHKVSYFESFGPASPIGHMWSLSIEEQFYLIWPLLLIIGLKMVQRGSELFILILIVATLSVFSMAWMYEPGTDPSRVYYGTETRAFGLLIGAALAIVWPSQWLRDKVPIRARLMLDLIGGFSLLILIILIGYSNKFDDFLYPGGFVLLSVVTAILLAVLAHPASYIGKLMGCKPLHWIGVRSYSLYLWHFPVIILSNTSDVENSSVKHLIIQLMVSFVLAAISYKYIEEPFRRGSFRKDKRGETRLSRRTYFRPLYLGIILSTVIFLIIFRWYVALSEPDDQTPVADDSIHHIKVSRDKKDESKNLDNVATQVGKGITVIGDSVILDAAPYLEELLPGIVVNGKVGRQMIQAQEVIDQLQSEGKLGDKIIIELGTNGPFNSDKLRNLLESLNDSKEIFLVNTRVPRDWQDTVNKEIAAVANEFNHITVIDWYSASEGKNNYFYQDGVHLNSEGAKFYASILVEAVKVKN